MADAKVRHYRDPTDGYNALMKFAPIFVGLFLVAAITATAQDTLGVASAKPTARSGLFVARDAEAFGIVVAGAALVSRFDERVTHRLRSADLQNSHVLHNIASTVRVAADPGAIITSVSMFALGRVFRKAGPADAGLHAGEAIIASGIVTQVLKHVIGRARPYTVGDTNAFVFHGVGSDAGYTSMPSGHTTAAFAAAAAFSGELRIAYPHAARTLVPLLYGVAAASSASRVYDDKHWLSDIIVGAGIGTIVGHRVVTYAHSNSSSKLNALRMHSSLGIGDGGAPLIVVHGVFR